jgi:Fic family protein
VIRDAGSNAILYLPPEAKDLSKLMVALFMWINAQIKDARVPPPLVAALAHYPYATIHPDYDGNGRTARLLTNLVLHKTGYGLNGIYSLEEHYAKNLGGYYEALSVGASHNYYCGRAEALAGGAL